MKHKKSFPRFMVTFVPNALVIGVLTVVVFYIVIFLITGMIHNIIGVFPSRVFP